VSSTVRPPQDLDPPILVADDEALDLLLADLEGEAEIAVDTEANSFFRYHERVCLIQVTAKGRDYLVDPLAELDLDPLGRVIADPDVVKIFHDGEYDVLLLRRSLDWTVRGLFDTRVAAAALGVDLPGLAGVVHQHFGIELDKSQQRSDWTKRPLSARQIEYARLDTHYLVPLAHRMRAQLEELGRMRVVEGECRRLETLEPPEVTFDPNAFVKIKGSRTLDMQQLQALRELFVARDAIASRRDVPPFKVVGNLELVEVARRMPKNEGQLGSVPRLSPRVVRRIGQALLEAVARARELGPLDRMPRPAPKNGALDLDEAGQELHERLKAWRRSRAAEEGMDASLILNRHVLGRIASTRPTTADELAIIEGLQDWQLEEFSRPLVDLVRGFERALANGEIELPRRRRRR
jgi:ribonuclease D